MPECERREYKQHRPEETCLFPLVRDNLEGFLAQCRQTYRAGIPCYAEKELREYLECGIHSHGFARAVCSSCGHELLLAFSCKRRGVCPSCNARRMSDTAARLIDTVLPPVRLRQWVLSVPFDLRIILAKNPAALSVCGRIFVEEISAGSALSARGGACANAHILTGPRRGARVKSDRKVLGRKVGTCSDQPRSKHTSSAAPASASLRVRSEASARSCALFWIPQHNEHLSRFFAEYQ